MLSLVLRCQILLVIISSFNTKTTLSSTFESNHKRKLLQIPLFNSTQNGSLLCDWTYSDNETCVIFVPDFYPGNVKCNPDYANCEIIITDWYFEGVIHCPQHGCDSCIIDCGVCIGLEIKGYNCHLLSINISFVFESNIVNAPGNDGVLQITNHFVAEENRNLEGGFTTVTHNDILSSSGTANIAIILSESSFNTLNTINGSLISGFLNFSCVENAACDSIHIICGPFNTKCNIECSSEDSGCEYMTVSAKQGTVVNWYCDNSQKRVCLKAQIECGNMSNPFYSKWKYDDLNQWYYTSANCVENWTIPLVTCTFTGDDTCYINKAFLISSRIIQCFDELENCQVQLGDDTSTQIWSFELNSIVHCPSLHCKSCMIQCINSWSCSGITIYGYNCSLLHITIRSLQDRMIIYAPGNGGELVLLTNYEQSLTSFSHSIIYSVPGTKNMILNFDQCDGIWDWREYANCDAACGYNFIDATYVTDYLNMTCNGISGCSHSNITCPVSNGANCNIDCSSGKDACCQIHVYAIEGTHDVNWMCNNDELSYDPRSCYNSQLYCKQNFSQSSTMKYVNGTWQLENKTDGCLDIPTFEPTLYPTVPTIDPTQSTAAPSIAPSAAPTYSPTSAPIIAEIFGLDKTELSIIVTVSLLCFVLIVAGLIYYYKYYKIEQKSLHITNAMVIVIGIGQYDYDPPDNDTEICGQLADLQGVDKDIENMITLFHNTLNYDVYPEEYVDDIRNGRSPKTYWTEKELHTFLMKNVIHLEKNIENYDGLIVIISSHGIPGYICTSDYRIFSKLALHRIFSANHPKLRSIPRIFIFDMCSGDNQQEIRKSISEPEGKEEETNENTLFMQNEKGKTMQNDDITKRVTVNDIESDNDNFQLWVKGDLNPDYRLALIEAANPGFQSKLRTDIGSYVVHSFYEKTMEVVTQNKRTFIHKIFDKVQDELHRMGKQHPVCTWNEDTRYIRFKRHDGGNRSATHIQMTANDIDSDSAE
eukprot:442842_1